MKENSIEEITFVENEIKNTRRLFEEVGCYVFFDEDLCKSIEHILSAYKRVLKENETLKELLQGNLYEMYKYYRNLANSYQGNCISKEKVKNMIKEKEWALENYNCDESDYKQSQAIGACNVLQELLKESEE